MVHGICVKFPRAYTTVTPRPHDHLRLLHTNVMISTISKARHRACMPREPIGVPKTARPDAFVRSESTQFISRGGIGPSRF